MMRGDEGCQHYLTLTFEKFLGVLRGYIATMNISLFKKKEKEKEKGNHVCFLESGTNI
jgi:small nuclear ribonucleoprotein (snRNP)-like protein